MAQFIRQIIPTSAPMVDVFATQTADSIPGYYCERVAALALLDFWKSEADEDGHDDQDEKQPPHGVNPMRWVQTVRFVDHETFTTDTPASQFWLGTYWEADLLKPEIQRQLSALASAVRTRMAEESLAL
jgi:hypothetical protein